MRIPKGATHGVAAHTSFWSGYLISVRHKRFVPLDLFVPHIISHFEQIVLDSEGCWKKWPNKTCCCIYYQDILEYKSNDLFRKTLREISQCSELGSFDSSWVTSGLLFWVFWCFLFFVWWSCFVFIFKYTCFLRKF